MKYKFFFYFSEEPKQGKGKNGGKPYACPHSQCRRSFKSHYQYDKHIRYSCIYLPWYKCGHCNHKAHQAADIRRHIDRIHNGSAFEVIKFYDPKDKGCNYVCPNTNCHKKYKYKSGLHRHLRYECGKPRLKCSYCDFKSCYKSFVKKHWSQNHSDEEFNFEAKV